MRIALNKYEYTGNSLYLITWGWAYILAMTGTMHPCIDNNPFLNALYEKLIDNDNLPVRQEAMKVPSVQYKPGMLTNEYYDYIYLC